MSIKNLEKLYKEATDEEIKEGLAWYKKAHSFAVNLSLVYGVPLQKVCRVISCLSPATSWEVNKKQAAELIEAFKKRGYIGMQGVRCSTYGLNKRKAMAILLDEAYTWDKKKNPKTFNFALNIEKPYENTSATIDRHAIKAYVNDFKAGSVTVSKTLYEKVEKAYKKLAERFSILTQELQAIIWLVYKRKVQR